MADHTAATTSTQRFYLYREWDALVLTIRRPGDGSLPEHEFTEAELADLRRVESEFNAWQRRLAELDAQGGSPCFHAPSDAGVKLVDESA